MRTDASKKETRILVVEDNSETRNHLSLILKRQRYQADFAIDAVEARERLRQNSYTYGLVLLDLGLRWGVSEILNDLQCLPVPLHIIALAEAFGIDGELDAARLGVSEILLKPISWERLLACIENWLRKANADQSAAVSNAGASEPYCTRESGTEAQMFMKHVAAADVPVLIQGETGAGKEVLARQLHANSPRAQKRFLKLNCAALPSELVESELFGYDRGAFTGAFKANPGKFEMANGGTIFLDEIGDMDFKLQAKLLQVLQDREFLRLGSSEPCRVDVRVIAATHADLERSISDGRFREDLYYRLNIITMRVPPLRERTDEIMPLAHYFIRRYATPSMPPVDVTPVLRDALLSHDWPGNVRELENVIRKLLVIRRPDLVAEDLARNARRRINGLTETQRVEAPMRSGLVGRVVSAPPRRNYGLSEIPRSNAIAPGTWAAEIVETPADPVPPPIANAIAPPVSAASPIEFGALEKVDRARREAEKQAILSALNTTLWNRKRAAKALNIDYKAFLYKMKKLGIADIAASRVAI